MEFKRTKHIHDGLTAGGQCPMCRQTITEQTLPQVKGEFAASLRRIQAEGCQLTAQCKEVQELDAKARTVFEQFREDDIAAGEAELEELSGQRKQALEQAEERRNFHQQELERLHSEIQSTELDRECGMLSQEEIEELNRARTEFAGLNAKIEVLSKLVQASPEAAGKQEQDIKQMQASIQQKKELLSALAFYISKRVEINFSIIAFRPHTLWLELALVGLLLLLMAAHGKYSMAVKWAVGYCALLLFQQYILPASPKIIATSFTIFATYARRMFPCLMTGSLMLKCTPLRYFIVGLRQLRVPQRLIVAVSVTLRYFPAIREEMGYIRDAMKLRDVRGLARLEGTVIPLMVSATETAEELSAAAVTRGIEDPAPKTSAVFLRLSPVDLAGMAAGLVLLALSFVVQ